MKFIKSVNVCYVKLSDNLYAKSNFASCLFLSSECIDLVYENDYIGQNSPFFLILYLVCIEKVMK